MKILLSIITFFVISACNTSSENKEDMGKDVGIIEQIKEFFMGGDENKSDSNKEFLETERRILEKEKKLLEQEKINLYNKKIAIEEEAKLQEKNRVIKRRNEINQEFERTNDVYYGNTESVISNFLSAENSRNFESIFSFYSPYLRRYFGHNNPTYSSLQNVYRKAWNSTPYSRNTLLSIDQISGNEFIVKINYEWSKNSNASQTNNKFDNLKFVLDNENKIVEVSSLN